MYVRTVIMTDQFSQVTRRILNQKLKGHFKIILCLLYERKNVDFNISQLYAIIYKKGKEEQQTGLRYKQNTLDAIKMLKDANLIDVIKNGKQEQLITLTREGKQIAELIFSTQNYGKYFMQFQDALKDKIFAIPDYILMSLEADSNDLNENAPDLFKEVEDARITLISKGWVSEEVEFYNKYRSTLIYINDIFDKNFIYIVVYRYSNLIQKENKLDNPITNVIIKNLITDTIEQKIDYSIKNRQQMFLGHTYLRYKNPSLLSAMIVESTGSIFQYPADLQDIIQRGLLPSCMTKEISDMIYAYLYLLDLPPANLGLKVREIFQTITTLRETKELTALIRYKLHTLELFMTLYKKYCKGRDAI